MLFLEFICIHGHWKGAKLLYLFKNSATNTNIVMRSDDF